MGMIPAISQLPVVGAEEVLGVASIIIRDPSRWEGNITST